MRGRRAVLTAMLVACAWQPAPALAQGVPTMDKTATATGLGWLLGDWLASYQTLTKWRGQLLSRVQQGNRFMDNLDGLRGAVERNSWGEIIGFGQTYIDLGDLANNDTADSLRAKYIDTTRRRLLAFEDTVRRQTRGLRTRMVDLAPSFDRGALSPLFTNVSRFATTYGNMMGDQLARLEADSTFLAAADLILDGGGKALTIQRQFYGKTVTLDRDLGRLDSLVTSFTVAESLRTYLSSGRAKQLRSLLSVEQSTVAVDITAMEAEGVLQRVMAMAHDRRRMRRSVPLVPSFDTP